MNNNQLPQTPLSLIIYFLKPYKGTLIILTILIICGGIIPIVDSYLIKCLIDYSDQMNIIGNSYDFANIILKWALIYGVWWEGINWLWRAYDYFYLKSLPRIKANTIEGLYSYVQRHSHHFFQKNLTGFITNRITEAATSLELIFAISIEKIVRKVVVISAATISLYSIKPVLATTFIIWLTVFLGISSLCSYRINTLSGELARRKSLISGKIVDAINNINVIRMFNNFQYEEQYLHKYTENMVQAENILQWYMFKLRYVLGLSCSISIFVMIYYLGLLRSQHEISTGDFAFVITVCISLSYDIWDFTQELGDLFEEIGGFSQSIDLLQAHHIQDHVKPKKLEITHGTIEFRNVSFNYKHNDNIFENKTVIIKGKEKVGLVGFSGSGKSTFVNLISRTYDIAEGQIYIDNCNIAEVSQKDLREFISIIPQEPILFNRPIIENIRYSKLTATQEEIEEAARKAYIHDDIMKTSDGYNTLCGEKGSILSGGQKQRIAIARAILRNSPILILDEATSALDSITERLIQESLSNLMENKTVLVIAHRLSTLQNMDRILVFDKGTIVEDGPHEKLIQTGKLYRKLWSSQVRGFIAE